MTLDRWDDTAKVTYDHAVWNELCSLRFIDGGHNAVIMGPVGVGKTFLATALGHAAVRRRYSVHFERCDRLLKRLRASRLDNSHEVEMRKLLRVDLLIVDDFALQPLDALDTADIYELIVERHRAAATIATSNREPVEWLGYMADPLLAQSAIDRLQSAAHEHCVARKGEGVEGALGGGRVSGSAGVYDHDRDEAAVTAVSNGGLDAHLGGDADNRKGDDLRVAQRELERGALEGGHREPVEDGLRWERGELGHERKAGGVAQERRHDVLDSILALPGHSGAQLGDAHQLGGQRHVSAVEDPDSGPAGGIEHPPHPVGHLRAVGELADDTDLHVKDDEGDAIRVTDVGQAVGDRKVAVVLHGAPSRVAVAG
jgi:hypothetical protein